MGARGWRAKEALLSQLGIGGKRKLSHLPSPSIGPCLGWNWLELVGQGIHMDRAIIETSIALGVHPAQRMPQPIVVVAVGKVLARLGSAALLAVLRRMQGGDGLPQ